MLDDDDGKIRRNLIVVCVGILVAAWLQFPAPSLFGALSPDLSDTPIDRFWALGFALIGYLSWRYKFTEEGISHSSTLKDSFYSRLRKDTAVQVDVLVRAFNTQTEFPTQLNAYADLPDDFIARRQAADPWDLTCRDVRPIALGRSASVQFARLYRGGDNSRSVPRFYYGSIRWSAWLVVTSFAKAVFFGLIYSSVGPQRIAPVALTLAAETVLGCRIYGAYMCS